MKYDKYSSFSPPKNIEKFGQSIYSPREKSSSSKYSLNFFNSYQNQNAKNGSDFKYNGSNIDGLDSIKIDKFKVEELISNYKPCVKPNNFNFTFYDKSINSSNRTKIYNSKLKDENQNNSNKLVRQKSKEKIITVEEVSLYHYLEI